MNSKRESADGSRERWQLVDLFSVPENPEQDDELLTDCAKELRQRLRNALNRARVVLQGAVRRQKRNYDKKAVAKSYLVRSLVWLHNRQVHLKPGGSLREQQPSVKMHLTA